MHGIKGMLSRRGLAVLAATTLGTLASAAGASAATFTVNDTGDFPQNPAAAKGQCVSTDGGTCTLRAAVQAADQTGGDNTINLPAGTYKFSPQQSAANSPGCKASSPPSPCDPSDPAFGDLDVNVPNGGTNITVLGAGAGSTVIDANSVDRAFFVHPAGGLTLQGLTIENGSPSSHSDDRSTLGGAVDSHSVLSATDVTFSANSASNSGGAIFSSSDQGSTLTLARTVFTNNTAFNDDGGAIFDQSPVQTSITGSSFAGNFASYEGGAVWADGAAVVIDATTFSQNSTNSSGGGGGALYYDGSHVAVTNSSFIQNVTHNEGGAGRLDDGSENTFTHDLFSGNTARGGGALSLYSDFDEETLQDDQFTHNVGTQWAGAIDWEDGNLILRDSSILDNNGSRFAGGLYTDCGCSLTMINTTIAGNTAEFGGGVGFDTDESVAWVNDTISMNSSSGGGGGGVYCGSCAFAGGYTPPASDPKQAGGVENIVVAQNGGGDCDTNDGFSAAAEPLGHNMDSDRTCFGANAVPGDVVGVNPNLGEPADNGGPIAGDPNTGQETLLTQSDVGGPAVDAGSNNGCPATDERGVTRPQGAACDIGAYEAAAAGLSLTISAPTTVAPNNTFEYVITVTNNGPATSTGTAVADTVPSGERLWAATPSQGSCSTSGGVSATCALGNLASGAHATVTLVVSDGKPGTVATDTATASNDQGSHASAAASTTISSTAPPPTKPKKPGFLGKLVLDGTTLFVRNGKVGVRFTCQSSKQCSGLFSVTTRLKLAKSHNLATVVCTVSKLAKYTIGANKTKTVHVPVHQSCLLALKSHHNRLGVKITTRPRTAQQGLVKRGTMILK